MLNSSSSQWKQLQHAYGSAENIPFLLKQLSTTVSRPGSYTDEPWFSLWSALCHQGDVYSASFAAVPHLVQLASLRPPQERTEFVLLVTSIKIARNRQSAPKISQEFELDYFAALEQLRPLIGECLNLELTSEDDVKTLLGGLAVVNGLPNLGNAIMELSEPNVCPNCETDVPPFGYALD